MNLYLRGLDGNIKLGDSIRDDQHKGLDADYVITNPPFNEKEWGRNAVADDDPRFKYGMPRASKQGGNFAFIQHMLSHVNDETGMVGTVMANGSLSVQSKEGDIRQNIVEDDILDTIVALPGDLFYTTSIPVCVWILSKGKEADKYRDRPGETLFIDARDMYEEVDKSLNRLTTNQIERIAETVRAYRGEEDAGEYHDEKGYCKIATISEIQDQNWVLTPGRYAGVKQSTFDDEEPFDEKMGRLTEAIAGQFEENNVLEQQIKENLRRLGYDEI
jgi:type I restriction enzyme M protein